GLAGYAAGEGARHDDRAEREEGRPDPRPPDPQAERQESGLAGGVLRVPPVLVDDQVLRGEERRERGGRRLDHCGGEDTRVEELHDLVDHDRPARKTTTEIVTSATPAATRTSGSAAGRSQAASAR